MTDNISDLIGAWVDDSGPVALHLKQRLLPVEGEGGIIFPPTYADIGYNIDTLSDGTKVALIDSVGSQANRMEPIFKCEPYSALVPQISIQIRRGNDEELDGNNQAEEISLLDLAHRSADATVHASPELAKLMEPAFNALRTSGNATPLCQVAPTSLVFGFWDSRGPSNEKRPRLVRSVIRAWDVEPLHAAAQFNSLWKLLDERDQEELRKAEKAKGSAKRSVAGLADSPSVFRMDKFHFLQDGKANPEARVLGGISVRGTIQRDVTINLVALRRLNGASKDIDEAIGVRRYLLALTLIAGTADMDLYLREGCHLRYADEKDRWTEIHRRGDPKPCGVDWSSEESQNELIECANEALKPFKEDWPKGEKYRFDVNQAKKLLKKRAEEDDSSD